MQWLSARGYEYEVENLATVQNKGHPPLPASVPGRSWAGQLILHTTIFTGRRHTVGAGERAGAGALWFINN